MIQIDNERLDHETKLAQREVKVRLWSEDITNFRRKRNEKRGWKKRKNLSLTFRLYLLNQARNLK